MRRVWPPNSPRHRPEGRGNPVKSSLAKPASEINLCNIHFHEGAEHKAKAFSIYKGEGDHSELKPGDTIEVHWVHTSCDVEPGPTLGSCLSKGCGNPELRVETQVFTLVNDPSALDFKDLEQASDLPTNTGTPVQFLGSTTGPSYTEAVCSPYQVTWSVRPQCAKLDINTVGEWCKGNTFDEDHAHGVRKLVTNPKLLSDIE